MGGFLQDTEDPAGYTQAGHCYTMRIGFAPWNGMSMASHFQTAYAQSLITGYKKGGDVAQSRAYLRSKCQEQCDASDDCTGFYYGLKQYWIDRANDGGDGTGSALGACQLFYQHSDICVTDCLASPYFAKALEARGSDYETGMVTWLHSTWAGQCESYCGQPPAGRSDLQGKSHWSILQGKNGYPTCTDPVGDCAPEIARYEADKTMCPTWMHPDSFTTYKKSMTAETPTEPPTDAPTESPTDAPTVTDAPTDAPTDASTCNRQDQGGFTDTAGWNIGGNAVTTCGWMEHICKPMSECKCYEQGGDTKCQWTTFRQPTAYQLRIAAFAEGSKYQILTGDRLDTIPTLGLITIPTLRLKCGQAIGFAQLQQAAAVGMHQQFKYPTFSFSFETKGYQNDAACSNEGRVRTQGYRVCKSNVAQHILIIIK